jgi:hypothetical protein
MQQLASTIKIKKSPKSCQKMVKKLSKSCQEGFEMLSKNCKKMSKLSIFLSKSCQKFRLTWYNPKKGNGAIVEKVQWCNSKKNCAMVQK